MMLLTTVDVTCRYLFNNPISGAVELNEYLIVLITFLGLAYTQSVGGHVRTDIALSHLSPKLQNIIYLFVVLPIVIALFSIITWKTAEGAYASWQEGEYRLGGIQWFPMWPPTPWG